MVRWIALLALTGCGGQQAVPEEQLDRACRVDSDCVFCTHLVTPPSAGNTGCGCQAPCGMGEGLPRATCEARLAAARRCERPGFGCLDAVCVARDQRIDVRCEEGSCVARFSNCAEEWVPVPYAVTFASGSTAVDRADRQVLQDLVRDAQQRSGFRRMRVEELRDPCNEQPDSARLAAERATAVRDALVAIDVPPEVIEVRPADEAPAGPCTEGGLARVEFSFQVCR